MPVSEIQLTIMSEIQLTILKYNKYFLKYNFGKGDVVLVELKRSIIVYN